MLPSSLSASAFRALASSSRFLSSNDPSALLGDPRINGFVSSIFDRHDRLAEEYNSLTSAATVDVERLTTTGQALAEVSATMEVLRAWEQRKAEAQELETLSADADEEIRELAADDLLECRAALERLGRDVMRVLVPPVKMDAGNAMLEVRAGAGGREAALFSQELFEMYEQYSKVRGWAFKVLSISETDEGGYKNAIASISGRGVYGGLKLESGVHRVQRIPTTETQGRIHTSTVMIAVLPEPTEVDIKIDESKIRIETFRSSGAGGQAVNTTDSAVRLTHIPTGISVSSQGERSQHNNRTVGMKMLLARVYDFEKQKVEAEQLEKRREVISAGSGARSDRIRTYNFPQDRVTDHRIKFSLSGLETVLSGERLAELTNEVESEFAKQELQRRLSEQ